MLRRVFGAVQSKCGYSEREEKNNIKDNKFVECEIENNNSFRPVPVSPCGTLVKFFAQNRPILHKRGLHSLPGAV